MPNNQIRTYSHKTNKKKVFLIGLIISFIVNSLLCLGIFFLEYKGLNYFLYLALVDAFSISGLIMVLFFLLTFFAEKGAFDMLAYSIQVAFYTVFYKNLRDSKLPKSYAEYKEMKYGKEKTSVSYMLYVGLIFMVIGLLLLIPYYNLRP